MIDLVIKLHEEEYEEILNGIENAEIAGVGLDDLSIALKNGTQLPKGHGKLGDLDALKKEVSSWGMNDYEPSDFLDAIDQADVIIEADTESEVGE